MAADFVGVARSDALEGGSDLALSGSLLVGGVKKPVGREDDVGLAGEDKPLADWDSRFRELVTLLLEGDRVEDHAVAYDVCGAVPENA